MNQIVIDSAQAPTGWLASKGANTFGQDQDDIIIMPYTSVMKRLSGDTRFRALNVASAGPDAGYWLASLLTQFAGFITLVSPESVGLAFSVSAIIGVVFGFFPALKAANLDPIEALRYE